MELIGNGVSRITQDTWKDKKTIDAETYSYAMAA